MSTRQLTFFGAQLIWFKNGRNGANITGRKHSQLLLSLVHLQHLTFLLFLLIQVNVCLLVGQFRADEANFRGTHATETTKNGKPWRHESRVRNSHHGPVVWTVGRKRLRLIIAFSVHYLQFECVYRSGAAKKKAERVNGGRVQEKVLVTWAA